MMHALLLAIGLTGLWLGTELAVRGALVIAKRRGLSHMFVGMTLMAIGTDVPELIVAITAGIQRLGGVETSGVVLGAAVGSCFGQITLVLGIAGLFGYLTLGKERIWNDGAMLVGSIVLLFLVSLDGVLTRVEGGVLVTTYVVYFVLLTRRERRTPRSSSKEPEALEATPTGWRPVVACVLGLAVVTGASHLTLAGAIGIADDLGVEQTIVGILLVGFGTSLPELALSVGAIMKKAGSLSVGNIIGSNVFDALVPAGVASVLAGLELESTLLLRFDLPVLLIVTAVALAFFRRKKGLQKTEALALIAAYVIYATVRIAIT